jgi:hypothetical protein
VRIILKWILKKSEGTNDEPSGFIKVDPKEQVKGPVMNPLVS